MKSLLFGSIGSLVECSEIQRKAFNEAFKEFGVNWYWNVDPDIAYLKLQSLVEGASRVK